MRNRIKYSQNFLVKSTLVKDLLSKSDISSNDIVIEIGAGQGIITKELLKKAKRVIAFELDGNLFKKLSQKFQNERFLELKQEDFLNYNLPNVAYKIFSNIPFNRTADIIKKLTGTEKPPDDCCLVVQEEAVKRFAGKPFADRNSQISVLLNPWFEFRLAHQFKRDDFLPRPNVNIVLIEIKKREKPLVEDRFRGKYEDFVTFAFNQFKPTIAKGLLRVFGKNVVVKLADKFGFSPNSKPSELDFQNWIVLFNSFLEQPEDLQSHVKDSYAVLLRQQKNIEKIHRTRVDKNWRNSGT